MMTISGSLRIVTYELLMIRKNEGDSLMNTEPEKDNITAWNERNQIDAAELAAKDDRSILTFYGTVGVALVMVGVFITLFSNLYAGINAAALGVIIMGIGEILRYLRRIDSASKRP